MGSYPLLIGIPLSLAKKTVIDVAVVDWGMRSVTALPVPIRINELPASALKWLPGIPKKAIAKVIAKRPFKNVEDYRKIAGISPIDSLIRIP
jgi:radical SAM superfamily enzyme with C-terminal helix-hairpin-helix motif